MSPGQQAGTHREAEGPVVREAEIRSLNVGKKIHAGYGVGGPSPHHHSRACPRGVRAAHDRDAAAGPRRWVTDFPAVFRATGWWP
ncbi:hypothetical protein Aph02nite_40860 [Actinoplanes philippinensis]|nr:hypothetical protein Aph02nite_40860 [Actinoplanes philippinensis]